MPKFLIERTVPGINKLSAADLQGMSRKSCDVVSNLNQDYTWHQSYVLDNRLICIHEADDEAAIREHARRGGFPIDRVTLIASEIGPETAR